MSVTILYKYTLVVRVICEKYRMREEANFTSRLSDEGSFSVLETGVTYVIPNYSGFFFQPTIKERKMTDDSVGRYFEFDRANLNGEKKHGKVPWFQSAMMLACHCFTGC
jgi:hypothetical protein